VTPFRAVDFVEATELANKGEFVIAGANKEALNMNNGHVAVLMPGTVESTSWGNINVPNAISRSIGGGQANFNTIRGLNYAFSGNTRASINYYWVPKQ
jgi:hypothetical protein